MQSTTTKMIGWIDAEYPYIKQIRSWHRWQGGQLDSPAEMVALYLSQKFNVEIQPCNWNMQFLDRLISQWIDSGRITANNCPELFPPAR
jgi:hypothetical protein